MADSADFAYLPTARNRVLQEQNYLQSEYDALDGFHDRIATLDVGPSTETVPTHTAGTRVLSTQQSNSLDAVRTAYRETLMSVNHYQQDYDESLVVNMAHEFGLGLSQTIASDQRFTRSLKQSLLKRSQIAQKRREEVLADLSEELVALRNAKSELEELAQQQKIILSDHPINRSYEELVTAWEDLNNLEQRYRHLCKVRQSQPHLHRRQGVSYIDAVTLCEYLYGDLSVTHPILADAVSQLDQLYGDRQQVFCAITHLD